MDVGVDVPSAPRAADAAAPLPDWLFLRTSSGFASVRDLIVGFVSFGVKEGAFKLFVDTDDALAGRRFFEDFLCDVRTTWRANERLDTATARHIVCEIETWFAAVSPAGRRRVAPTC